jgi:hypothetical protein
MNLSSQAGGAKRKLLPAHFQCCLLAETHDRQEPINDPGRAADYADENPIARSFLEIKPAQD